MSEISNTIGCAPVYAWALSSLSLSLPVITTLAPFSDKILANQTLEKLID